MPINCNYEIIEKNGKYIGIGSSSHGIMTNTIPYESVEYVKKSLFKSFRQIKKFNIGMNESNVPRKYAEIIFNLDEDPAKYWDDSLKIHLDYVLYSAKQKLVADSLRKIPPGEVISYGGLAKMSGIPKASRFVGNCMANNLFPLLIPCHRVINSDGRLGNYSSADDKGPARKLMYLRKENSTQFITKM